MNKDRELAYIPPIPPQYKNSEETIHKIGELADKLYPIITELGDSLEIESNNCLIILTKLRRDDGIIGHKYL